ncbi:ARF-binding protein [Cystobasidiomycetes sp. EMM_F5]
MYGSSRYPGSGAGSSSSRGTGWGDDGRGFGLGSSSAADPYDQLRAFIVLRCSLRQVLDALVKNCGYPMHLQIATKDFLNELVRRFPERPPAFPPPPMNKILELIHEWKNTICVSSKYKEDLSNIRDMHRLLGHFNSDVMRQGLKSPDELEEEDRAAQAAKLQELIRRGTPKDLAAAQELMKVMAGAEPGKKPDYAQQTAKELASIQHRILMLNEMLDNVKPNERFAEGDAFDQIAVRCRNVQPKIQKWIGSAEEDQDADKIDKLLLMNDLINNVLERYESFKKGDRSASAEINPAFAKKSSGSSRSGSSRSKKSAAPNLIDFDEPVPAAPSTTGLEGAISLDGLSLGTTSTPQTSNGNNLDLFSGLDFTSSTPQPNATGTTQPFYSQYQSQVPTGQAQQAVSWANMGAVTPTHQANGAMATTIPNSPNRGPHSAARVGTSGAISLGMASTPKTPSSFPSSPAPQPQQSSDPYSLGNFGQSQSQKPIAKARDPFEDLLS